MAQTTGFATLPPTVIWIPPLSCPACPGVPRPHHPALYSSTSITMHNRTDAQVKSHLIGEKYTEYFNLGHAGGVRRTQKKRPHERSGQNRGAQAKRA